MKGDVLIIDNNHRKAAGQVMGIILPEIKGFDGKYVITVAGESGAGKSEIAASIGEELEKNNISFFIFQQDDYFVYPPKTNAEKRKENIEWVGVQEVRLDLLDKNLKDAIDGKSGIDKPLVDFNADSIGEETIDPTSGKVLIAEGTYTTLLENVNCRIFIDRTKVETLESRKKRAREVQDGFLEKILTIEHEIICKHKDLADIIISKEYDTREVK